MAAQPGKTEDLASLTNLNEAILLNKLKARYDEDDIYTYVGDILVAIDPFKQLSIYDKKHMTKYKNVARNQNPPHIYAVSNAAYYQMVNYNKHQCCVISGESGAGKTESCKYIIAQLVELSQGQTKTMLEQSIIKVNPLLEAFGNAQTLLNDNSSRFGKYIQLKFRNGQIVGAKINEYLLEKSRVVYQNPGEQNFHIFYCLFAGLNQNMKTKLKLDNPDKYQYMCEGSAVLRSKMQVKKDQFEELQNAMDLVGFEADNQENLFICLAAVLNMGNIEFGDDDNEYSFVKDKSGPLTTTAELMGIDPNLMEDILTVSITVARGESIKRHLNQEKAGASRDAIAKSLYDRLFRWIVNRINQLLAPSAEDMAQAVEIGILDIFGFEKCDTNSFEQLCINLASEQLQFFFNQHVFMLEQQEYKSEGIDVSNINFKDNRNILEFFLAKPIGVLALLDEECAFPKATDTTFVQKLHKHFEKLPFYSKPKTTATDYFTVSHYAGQVEYDGAGFLEKNRDSLPGGANELMQASKNLLIELIYKGTITRTGSLALGSVFSHRTGRLKKRPSHPPPCVSGAKGLTVGAQFKNSLQVLIEKMNQANPHFVHCIKPNHSKVPNKFDDKYVTTQLSCTGMLETTRIRKEGYAIRLTFEEFVERYKYLAAQVTMASTAANCRKILMTTKLEGYQIGKSKIFLKYWHVDRLIQLLEAVHKAADMTEKQTDLHTPPKEVTTEESSGDEHGPNADENGDVFVAFKGRFNKFGKEGTKQASVRWFKATQSDAVKTSTGQVQIWFHGIITRRQAEQRLVDKPNGSFLIRVSESQFGYSLSFRVVSRCKHFLLKQVNSGKYIVVGESRVHKTLEELVLFYQKHPINVEGDILTLACAAEDQCENDHMGTLMGHGSSSHEDQPPQLPPRMLSVSHGHGPPPPTMGSISGQHGKLSSSPMTGRSPKLSTSRGTKMRGPPGSENGPPLPPRSKK
ncbi:myosin-IIIb-like [Dysidea avara]|uniref:myosin-IIIb-like n=1 Tax=Dysidea avara TaxID=196820 RepID=UPI00332FB297